MRAQQTDGLSHVSRGLDIGYGVALAATLLLGVPAAFTSEFRGPAAFSLVLALVTIPLWLGRRRAAARRTAGDSNVKVWRWSVALATTAMMASLLPGAGPGALLLSLMGALVLGVDIGFWAGAIAGVGYAILLGLEIAVVYGGGAVDIIPQSGGILVMLLLVAAVGHLIRNVETARSELARANVRLRRALLVEGGSSSPRSGRGRPASSTTGSATA